MRALGRYAGATPWRRAPRLLWRRPTVLLALAGTAVVLAVTVAATPLFVASAGSAALAHQLDSSCPYTDGAFVKALIPEQVSDFQRNGYLESRRRAVMRATRLLHQHQPLIVSQHAHVDGLRADGSRLQQTALARDGALDHIEVLQRWASDGAWVSDTAVHDLGLTRGKPITLVNDLDQPDGSLVRVELSFPIAGVYRDLARSPVAPFWCSLRQVIYPPSIGSDIPTPSVVLLSQDEFIQINAKLVPGNVTQLFELPVDRRALTVQRAVRTTAEIARWRADVDASSSFAPSGYNTSALVSGGSLGHLVERAQLVQTSLRSTVGPVTVAGALIALLLVAAAGSFWAERRREEVALLVARGVGPLAMTAKALLEMLPALVVGAGTGWLLAVELVRALGPSPIIGFGGVRSAGVQVAAALALGALLLGVVAFSRFRAESERRRGSRASRIALIPWELGLLGLAGALLPRLVSGGTDAGSDGGSVGSVSQIDPLLIAFPLLVLAGGIALGLRAIGWWLPRLGRGGEGWSAPRYLAARRVSASRGVALLLVAAAALPAGVLVYSASMTATVRATVEAKVHVFNGTDLLAQVVTPGVPSTLAGHATAVDRLEQADLDGLSIDVIGVDPSTFVEGAYWNSRFSSASLRDLTSRLTQTRPGQPVPVLVSGDRRTRGPQQLEVPGFQALELNDITVQVVGTASHLPGEANGRPLLIIDRRILAAKTNAVFHQLWVRGDPRTITAELASSGAPVVYVQRANDVLDSTTYLPVSYAFSLLRALALLTGAIGTGGLLLYLETRTRSRRVAYTLARRMGLSRLAHLRSLLLEVGGLVGAGMVLGGVLAVAAAVGAYRRLDLDPYVPPGPLLVVPVGAVAAVVLGTAALAGIAVLAAQRTADRHTAAEVIRDAT